MDSTLVMHLSRRSQITALDQSTIHFVSLKFAENALMLL